MSYNPRNHYWIVGGDASRVYSSKEGDYVAVTDAAYTAWLAAGGKPTAIVSEDELGDVLAPLSLRPSSSGVLEGYKTSQARTLTVQIVAKVLLNHENRLRAIEGKAQVSAAQFRDAIKDIL